MSPDRWKLGARPEPARTCKAHVKAALSAFAGCVRASQPGNDARNICCGAVACCRRSFLCGRAMPAPTKKEKERLPLHLLRKNAPQELPLRRRGSLWLRSLRSQGPPSAGEGSRSDGQVLNRSPVEIGTPLRLNVSVTPAESGKGIEANLRSRSSCERVSDAVRCE